MGFSNLQPQYTITSNMRCIFCTLISLFSVLAFGQGLEHAYWFQNKLVLTIQYNNEGKWHLNTYIKVLGLLDQTVPFISTYLESTYRLPSVWVLDSNRVLTVESLGRNDDKRFTLTQTMLLNKDSLTKDGVNLEEFKRIYKENWEFYLDADLARQPIDLFRIRPLNDWWNVQYNHTFFENITFLQRYAETFKRNKITDVDFCYLSNGDKYHFYQRTENNLFIWSYNGGAKKETLFSDWLLEWHYSRDSVFRMPNLEELEVLRKHRGLGQSLLPDTTHFLPCTITDTAFFRGHNKAIQQGNQHWLINTSHGAIYYLADYGVVKVAQIENFRDYPPAILQQRLFVEDRDRGELMFFSKLIRTDREAPLPKYRSLLTPREVTQRFGALATLPKTKNRK